MTERINDRIDWEVRDGIARITLSHGRGNALDMAMAQAFREAAARVSAGAADGTVRVAVLAAHGSVFCVGGDLQEFKDAPDRAAHVRAEADILHEAILALRATPIPVVSVVHGTAAGAGIGLALAADISLIAAEATLRLAYNAVGITPDCGTSWMIPQRIGVARAADFAMTNRPISGAEAAAWGLVSRAVPLAELPGVAASTIKDLAAGATAAYGETKRLLNAAADRDLAAHLDDESATVTRMIVSDSGEEGMAAFFEKRAPVFHDAGDQR